MQSLIVVILLSLVVTPSTCSLRDKPPHMLKSMHTEYWLCRKMCNSASGKKFSFLGPGYVATVICRQDFVVNFATYTRVYLKIMRSIINLECHSLKGAVYGIC